MRPTNVEEVRDILSACCKMKRKVEAGGDEGDGEDIPIVEVVSVIPYGAGTSLEGHLQFMLPVEDERDPNDDAEEGEIRDIPIYDIGINASCRRVRIKRRGGISMDMCNFKYIGEVGDDAFVKVGSGVTRNALNEALSSRACIISLLPPTPISMQFMIDPGADATIGGMTACAASGTAAVKYGTMRENVLAMTVVLPPTTIPSLNDGSSTVTSDNSRPGVVRLGCNALKSSAGYNLPALFIGSEGTLGVMTDVTVKLHPIPAYVLAASCAFDDLHRAAEAVATIRTIVPVSRIELLDELSIRAFNQSLPTEVGCGDGVDDVVDDALRVKPMEPKPTLFMELESHSEISAREDLSVARNICMTDFGGRNFVSAADETTRKALWAARHRLYYSAIALRAVGDDGDEGPTSQSTIVTDVCVPLSHFADIISATAVDVRESGVVGPCFGHAGDGNFHCILPLKKNDTNEYRDRVTAIIENMTMRAISVGGTCTGEHGIGYGKKRYLARMHGEGGLSMMEALKRSIDPWNIMNPGKIVSNDFYGGHVVIKK
ncbi:LOW QUALITY PROTEIN: hypothetical protein ACHAXA_000288 [Cyclostephanos tholiformis]|uniref:D-lactate dehydrogenase (cytochrome) n=1 Tax=Cyclostephanos tholiformis TaxID=382380 RepID=A0ABD3R854_9STRA